MTTLKDRGFKGTRVAVSADNTYKLVAGTVDSGMIVLVAKTPTGEGYIDFIDAHIANTAFMDIVNRKNLIIL